MKWLWEDRRSHDDREIDRYGKLTADKVGGEGGPGKEKEKSG